MVVQTLSDEEAAAVRYLREQAGELLTPYYDTEFNLLRWAQGYSFKLDEALERLVRHLKFRRFYALDEFHLIREDKILRQYFPLGLVGKTGKGNNLLVVECAGRIDLHGILKSVQLTTFLAQRHRFQETMLSAMNKMELMNKQQCSVIYILDLEGLKLDSSLLSIVTGPYRILWASVYENYPEWISHMLVINAPSFMTMLWKAIGPLLPERTRNKVQIYSSGDNWRSKLEEHADMKYVPKYWGGQLVDKNGDPMCRDRLVIPMDMIPKHLYWQPDEKAPRVAELECVNLSAGQRKIITLRLEEANKDVFIAINRYVERTYSMAIYYSGDRDDENVDLEEMQDWAPDFDYPGMPTVDLMRARVPGAGIFKVKFGNEEAWFRSLTVHYRVRFVDANDRPVPFQIL